MLKMMTALVVVAMTSFGAGCSIPVEGPVGNGKQANTTEGADETAADTSESPNKGPTGTVMGGGEKPGTTAPGGKGTVDSNTQYVPEQDATKAQAIGTRMWSILTAAKCWHRQNSNDNYTFEGTNQYRYAGYETTAGQVGLNSVGTFGGYDMADIQISHTQYWLGIYDANTIAMSFFHGEKLVTNWYTAAGPNETCL